MRRGRRLRRRTQASPSPLWTNAPSFFSSGRLRPIQNTDPHRQPRTRREKTVFVYGKLGGGDGSSGKRRTTQDSPTCRWPSGEARKENMHEVVGYIHTGDNVHAHRN